MESLCAAPLYRTVENDLEISTRLCSQVLYDIGKCDASYLYLNERFLYTFACPIGSNEMEEKKGETFLVTTTTLPPLFKINQSNRSLLRGKVDRNSSNTTSNTTTREFKNTTNHNETINTTANASAVFVYSIKKENKNNNGTGNPIQPAFAVTLIVVFSFMSVLSFAVLLYFRRKKKGEGKKTMQRRPSSIMPEIVRHGPSSVKKEVRAVLNKMIKTVCRWNGEEPYRQRAPKTAPESAPPVPPRPPRQSFGKRIETLQFLRQTNPHLRPQPHSAIQKALQKPAVNFQDEGQRRADILKREAELERRRQERRKKSQRFQRIVRLRELHKKNGEEGAAKKEEEAH